MFSAELASPGPRFHLQYISTHFGFEKFYKLHFLALLLYKYLGICLDRGGLQGITVLKVALSPYFLPFTNDSKDEQRLYAIYSKTETPLKLSTNFHIHSIRNSDLLIVVLVPKSLLTRISSRLNRRCIFISIRSMKDPWSLSSD